jgi:Mn-dependent DtxR family transcriptional regulator
MKEIEKWILQILHDNPSTTMVVDISEEVGINCFAVNGHLSILERLGLVQSSKKSGVVSLSLTAKGQEEADRIFGGDKGGVVDKAKGSS